MPGRRGNASPKAGRKPGEGFTTPKANSKNDDKRSEEAGTVSGSGDDQAMRLPGEGTPETRPGASGAKKRGPTTPKSKASPDTGRVKKADDATSRQLGFTVTKTMRRLFQECVEQVEPMELEKTST